MKRPNQKFLTFLDYFLPTRTTESEEKVRIRLFVAMELVHLVGIIVLRIMIMQNEKADYGLVFSSMVEIWLSFITLLAVKFVRNTEFIFLLVIVTPTAMAIGHTIDSATLIFPSFLFLLAHLLRALVFIVDPLRRLVALALFNLITVVSVLSMDPLASFQVSSNLIKEPEIFESQVNAYRIVNILFLVAWFAYFKKLSIRERDAHIAKQTLDFRVGELTTILKSLIPRLDLPCGRLQELVEKLKVSASKDLVIEVEDELADAIQSTKSIAWIYRAYRNEPVGDVSFQHFSKHVKFLIGGLINLQSWDFDFRAERFDDKMLRGHVPSYLLLVLTVVERILRIESDSKERQLSVEMNLEDEKNRLHLKLGLKF